jgi:hypothetical protein
MLKYKVINGLLHNHNHGKVNILLFTILDIFFCYSLGSQTIQNQPQFQSNLSSIFSKANLTLFPFSRSKSTDVCWNSNTELNAFRRFVYSFYNRSLNFTDHVGFQIQNTREQDQAWKTKPITQSLEIPSSKSIGFNRQNFGLQPRQGKILLSNNL